MKCKNSQKNAFFGYEWEGLRDDAISFALLQMIVHAAKQNAICSMLEKKVENCEFFFSM